MAQFSIGIFEFVNLSRPPSTRMFQTEREVRPGVEGVTFWGLGRRSSPYQLTSVRDCIDVYDALQTLANYEAAAGLDPLLLTWGGTQWGLVFIHDVVPLDNGLYATLLGVGGTLGTSRAMLHCVWTLEFVPGQPQQ